MNRRQPEGTPRRVLDQHAEEAFDRTKARDAHDGLMQFAVLALVLQLEARGQVEVELQGGELPHAAQHITTYVDLGP